MSNYDVVILGGGPGGYNAAIRAGQLGLKAACVEGRATLGGTCLNVGCMPSKALLHASELYDAAMGAEFANLGIEVKPTLNLAQMMKQKDQSVAGLTKGIEFLFRKNKVDWIKGWGHIDGPGKVTVTDDQGGKVELTAKDIIIATGSEPTPLPGVEIDNKRILDSTGALSSAKCPSTWWSLAPASSALNWARYGGGWARRSPWSNTLIASVRASMARPERPCNAR